MTTPLDWADEVLDAEVAEQIRQIVQWSPNKHRLVLFDGRGARFAAALIGQAANKDVLGVDLSEIGEDDKALKSVFKTAKGAILFCEGLDAAIARRGRDRAANQQVAYLLQRLETFPGLVILATHLGARLDDAFARRFAAVVRFKAPASSRATRGPRSVPARKPGRSSPGRSKPRAPSRPRR
jgi:ATPase family associated with various cellular activities (AAA)